MEGDALLLATLATSLATAMTVVLAVRTWLQQRETAAAAQDDDEFTQPFTDDLLSAGKPLEGVRFAALGRLMRPKTLEELSELRRQLARAGMRSQEAVELYSVARSIAALTGFGLFSLLMLFGGTGTGTLFLGILALGGGVLGPSVWLRGRIQKRQEALSISLPPTLDLLVTCMEAGLGLEQALDRVARETGYSDPEMAEELSVVIAEMRAGLTVTEAFRKLADRVTSEEVRNLSNVIIQSAALGAALGRTLREYATSARRRRSLALEEVAGKVTARLALPLTMCLLPSAMLAMIGPAAVLVYRAMLE